MQGHALAAIQKILSRHAQHNAVIQFFFIILRDFHSFKDFFVELLTQLCMNAPPSHTASDSIRIIVHGFELQQIVVYRILSTIPAAVVVKLYKRSAVSGQSICCMWWRYWYENTIKKSWHLKACGIFAG